MKIAISFTNANRETEAATLAKQLGLPLAIDHKENYEFLLVYTEKFLQLQQLGKQVPGPIFVDFLSSSLDYRRQHTKGRNELISKAVGIKNNSRPTIIDATAGLGVDSFILASLGCEVLMLERSPIVAALLQDGLKRLFIHQQLKLLLIQQDACNYFKQLSTENYPDVVYLDPMFPPRTKTALVKKEMRILRDIVGENDDAKDLLIAALKIAKQRVVVKRPRLAPTLNDFKPDFEIIGKQQRFDVYKP